MEFGSALEYLEKFVSYEKLLNIPYGEKAFNLENLRDFLRDFGVDYNSQQIKFIQVAGSKGKGTVCTLISNYLVKNAKHVGLFTSPHFIDIRERIRINDQMISQEKFANIVSEIAVFIDSQGGQANCKLTYFDLLTVIALKFFIDGGVEYMVLEVGMGGRLDSTSVVKPNLCVLTRVEEEHLGVLGNNLEEILLEKLGILKEGVPLVVCAQSDEAKILIENHLKGREKVSFVADICDNAFGQNCSAVKQVLPQLTGSFDEDIWAELVEAVGIHLCSQYLNEHFPPSRPIIVIDYDDLLPGSQNRFTIGNRNGDARAHEAGSQMGESIVVAPGL